MEFTQTDALFLDSSKVFDYISHNWLIAKLNYLKIHPFIVNWISAFLTNCSQHTVVNDASSSSSHVTFGVPPRRVLGLLLFVILYVNNLPESISSCIRLFADDCVVYRAKPDKDDRLLFSAPNGK